VPPPAKELRHFVDQGWTIDDLCDRYECSRSTLYRWFGELKVKPPPRSSWARSISRERLAELYERLGTMDSIADYEGVTRGQVERAMQYHQLDRRSPADWAQPVERPPTAKLRQAYREKRSVRDVARQFGVSASTAYRWLTAPDVVAQHRPPGRHQNETICKRRGDRDSPPRIASPPAGRGPPRDSP
jgi:transposase